VTERAAGVAPLQDPQKGKKRMLGSDRRESWRARGRKIIESFAAPAVQ